MTGKGETLVSWDVLIIEEHHALSCGSHCVSLQSGDPKQRK